ACGLDPALPSFPTRRSSDLHHLAQYGDMSLVLGEGRGHALIRVAKAVVAQELAVAGDLQAGMEVLGLEDVDVHPAVDQQMVDLRSEEHTSELQSREDLVCRL